MTHKVGGAPFFARCNTQYINYFIIIKHGLTLSGSPFQYVYFHENLRFLFKYKRYVRGGTNWLLPNFCRSSFRPSVSTKIPRMGRT